MWRMRSGWLAAACVLIGCQTGVDRRLSTNPPSILIVMIDALRADRLGVNGYTRPTTPHIDRLAREGVNFTQAFSHSTWTKPSIATLFTSLYPSQHGVNQIAVVDSQGSAGQILSPRWTTLAERFQAAGYATGAVLNQVHLRTQFGFDQGFDHYRARRGTGAPRLNTMLLDWLESVDEGTPFFAYLHYLDVHWPYTRYVIDRAEALGPVGLSEEPPKSGRQAFDHWGRTLELPADLAALEGRYDHGVAFADSQVGALLAALEAMDRLANTVVVVTSDHGEAFLEHDKLLHGHAPYEEMIHIPLVIRLPAHLRSDVQVSHEPVGLISLKPTLLELAGLEPDPQSRGRSLAPLIRGGEIRPRLIFAESEMALAARGPRRKLLRFAQGTDEFYDLVADAEEQKPATVSCGADCDRLRDRLDDFAAAMANARARLDSEVAPLDEQDIEEMRALGYLD